MTSGGHFIQTLCLCTRYTRSSAFQTGIYQNKGIKLQKCNLRTVTGPSYQYQPGRVTLVFRAGN